MKALEHSAGSSHLSGAAHNTVFVVDDDSAALESFGAVLESGGLAPVLFPSCERFLHSKPASNSGCLLLDANFGGMSGLQLLGTMQSQGIEFPTIFVIGRFDAATQSRALHTPGVVAVLHKPVTREALLQAVQAAQAYLPPSPV